MRIQSASGISNQKDLNGLARIVQIFANDVQNLFSGQVTFADNFKAQIIQVTFDAPNVNKQIDHNLGVPATGYLALTKSVPMDIYNGTVNVLTKTYVTLRSTAAGTVTLIIL